MPNCAVIIFGHVVIHINYEHMQKQKLVLFNVINLVIFVTRFSDFLIPLDTFFKSLATKSVSWTNLIYIPRLSHDVIKASSLIYSI